MTDAEKHLWQRIRMQQLGVKFRRQHPVGSYVLDFACIDARLAIEIDGGQHAETQIEDSLRSAWLEERGWKVLRFWNNDVLQNIEGVLAEIDCALSKLRANIIAPPS